MEWEFSYNLKKRQVSFEHIVEIGNGVYPTVSPAFGKVTADVTRRNNSRVYPVPVQVHTLVKLALEKLDAHDGKHEPEEETDKEHIENGGDRVH